MRRLVSLLLSLCVLVSVLPANDVQAAQSDNISIISKYLDKIEWYNNNPEQNTTAGFYDLNASRFGKLAYDGDYYTRSSCVQLGSYKDKDIYISILLDMTGETGEYKNGKYEIDVLVNDFVRLMVLDVTTPLEAAKVHEQVKDYILAACDARITEEFTNNAGYKLMGRAYLESGELCSFLYEDIMKVIDTKDALQERMNSFVPEKETSGGVLIEGNGVKADLDGDGKEDDIRVRADYDATGRNAIPILIITINGKEFYAEVPNSLRENFEPANVYFQVSDFYSKDKLLDLLVYWQRTDTDYTSFDIMAFKFKKKKLSITFTAGVFPACVIEPAKTKNTLKLTGIETMNTDYPVKEFGFSIKNQSLKPKYFLLETPITKEYTGANIQVYKKTNLKNKAFKIKSGDTVTLLGSWYVSGNASIYKVKVKGKGTGYINLVYLD